MKSIESIEKKIETNRKTLLYCLRDNNWKVKGVEDDFSDWDLDQKWFIESIRENQGFELELWLFKYDGAHDGMDRVAVRLPQWDEPTPYGGMISIEFDGRQFEKQLKVFIKKLHELRIKTE